MITRSQSSLSDLLNSWQPRQAGSVGGSEAVPKGWSKAGPGAAVTTMLAAVCGPGRPRTIIQSWSGRRRGRGEGRLVSRKRPARWPIIRSQGTPLPASLPHPQRSPSSCRPPRPLGLLGPCSLFHAPAFHRRIIISILLTTTLSRGELPW